MKTVLTLGFFSLAISSPLFAQEGFTPADLIEATQTSVATFSEANPDHVEHFTGFKSWKSGTDAKVKVYVLHDGMSMDYNFSCAKHGELIHCTAN